MDNHHSITRRKISKWKTLEPPNYFGLSFVMCIFGLEALLYIVLIWAWASKYNVNSSNYELTLDINCDGSDVWNYSSTLIYMKCIF